MRLTCSSLSLYSLPVDEVIATVAKLGFAAMDLVGIPTLQPIHLDVARRDPDELGRLARAVEDAQVEVATIVTVPSDGMPSWDPAEVNARVGWAVSACRAVSAHRLVLDAGNPIPAEQVERKQAIARWKAMIDEAHRLTSKAGVAFAVEMPHTGTLAERFDQVEELLDAMDHPDIGLDYDTSHVYRSGTSIEDGLRIIGDRVVKVALRDVGEDGEFCRPGTGRVDFRGLFALLHARKYTGDIVIELETPGVINPSDQIREIGLSRTFIEATLAGL
ncbi:MAG: sugar phosphate isomerase/epimerase [Chloroflexi bacterium]|nr:MAG: sugar phosphate isomerase/epimerase [Chloroflexota bacterium]